MTERSESERAELGALADANASAEARLREALENTNQLLIDVMHDQEADIRDRASKQFDKNIDALSKPAPVAANASAARLRDIAGDALSLAEELAESYDWLGIGSDQARADIERRSCLEEIRSLRSDLEALYAHPHASDCDKQGEAKCPECGGSGSIEIDDGHFIKCKCAPSDRTADVTVELCSDAMTLCSDCPPVGYETDKTRCVTCPRRDAFTVGRR